MWPKHVKDEALVACGRRCCICHQFCGTKIECHHIIPEADGGPSNLENCIPLCLNCHADVGHYNPKHPKGSNYSKEELKAHRDRWFKVMSEIKALEERVEGLPRPAQPRMYEGQTVTLTGFVWREAFPGPPNYTSIEDGDEREVFWMLVLPDPLTLVASSPEDDTSYEIPNISRLQLMLDKELYEENRHLVLSNAQITGRLWPPITGHHHGDAQIEVKDFKAA